MGTKKVGGIYDIEDAELKWDMLTLESLPGKHCVDLTEFIALVIGRPDGECRFVVCPIPGVYKFDLENVSGAASGIDAIQSYLELILEGFTFYVWDRKMNIIHCVERNDYIYQPLTEQLPARKALEVQGDPQPLTTLAFWLLREEKKRPPKAGLTTPTIQTPEAEREPITEEPVDECSGGAMWEDVINLLRESMDTLLEYSSRLVDEAQYEDNTYDSMSMTNKAKAARGLAGRCNRIIYEHDVLNVSGLNKARTIKT